eukprot:2464930-Rhodomonas_salina.3
MRVCGIGPGRTAARANIGHDLRDPASDMPERISFLCHRRQRDGHGHAAGSSRPLAANSHSRMRDQTQGLSDQSAILPPHGSVEFVLSLPAQPEAVRGDPRLPPFAFHLAFSQIHTGSCIHIGVLDKPARLEYDYLTIVYGVG